MLKNSKSYKKTQAVKSNSNNKGPEQKKSKREDVHQNDVASQLDCHHFVKFTMNNSLIQVDQKQLNRFRKYSEQGKDILIFCFTYFTFYVFLYTV